MAILVLNSGSSSIKFSFYEARPDAAPRCLLDAELTGIGDTSSAKLDVEDPGETGLTAAAVRRAPHTLGEAIQAVFDLVSGPNMPSADSIGHRVVHPGATLSGHTRITPEVLKDLQQASVFAPLHEPAALEVIRGAQSRFPSLPQFACFDTVFHQTMPEEASTYALPQSIRDQGVRRYGFHGLSCESVLYQLQQEGTPVPKRLVIAHLGSGCSVTAVLDGLSIDTTMGLTPTGGVVMGTRPGDLDPGLLLYLLRQQKGDVSEAARAVETMLNHDAGMVALSGLPNDMREVRKAAANDDVQAKLAIQVFTRSITKAIGAYSFLLGGLDALIFTGGIGEHDAASRAEILANLSGFGIELDCTRNLAQRSGVRRIQASNPRTAGPDTAVLVVPAQEDLMIAIHVACMARSAK